MDVTLLLWRVQSSTAKYILESKNCLFPLVFSFENAVFISRLPCSRLLHSFKDMYMLMMRPVNSVTIDKQAFWSLTCQDIIKWILHNCRKLLYLKKKKSNKIHPFKLNTFTCTFKQLIFFFNDVNYLEINKYSIKWNRFIEFCKTQMKRSRLSNDGMNSFENPGHSDQFTL